MWYLYQCYGSTNIINRCANNLLSTKIRPCGYHTRSCGKDIQLKTLYFEKELIDYDYFNHLREVNRRDFMIWVITFLGTLFFGVLVGVMSAVFIRNSH